MTPAITATRRSLLKSGALLVGFSLTGLHAGAAHAQAVVPGTSGGAARGSLALTELDSFLAIKKDGGIVIYSGKVDLGTGHRIAMRQMVGEELSVPLEQIARIELIEGDSALTPNQGPTAGSTGVMRGGVELRQAAATAREALIALAAERLKKPAAELVLAGGFVSAADGSKVAIGDLVGEQGFQLKMNPKAALKAPAQYSVVGQSLRRPDMAAKVTGQHVYMHNHTVPGMLHGRVVRPASVGAKVLAIDEASVKRLPGVQVVRINDFVGVVSSDEWAAIRAAKELKVRWSDSAPLVGHQALVDWAKRGPFSSDETLVNKGDPARLAALASSADKLTATYVWPIQSHGSIGPSCAIADVQAGSATVWTASQASHRMVASCAALLGLPRDKVRAIYLDGAGCYGTNGHDDATADAALLSKAVGKPVRVQWSREDELAWDPKGPPQLLQISGSLTPEGRIDAWDTEMWVPRATANLEWIPLIGPQAAGIAQPIGQSTGLVSQNGDPSYPANAVRVSAHWLGASPLRPSNIRAPGKVANCFAVESFVDELATKAGLDPLAFRLRDLANPRGREVVERLARLMAWQARPSPAAKSGSQIATGRGMAYIHYKHNETFVAVGMDVEVNRSTGALKVKRVACTHDCGLMINPDAVRAQVEGNILQTLSRTLHEETTFDASRVTSTTWASYPMLRFSDVPRLDIELISRPNDPPLGAGEAASSPVPAALANAIFDATGARVRSAPFTPAKLKALLQA